MNIELNENKIPDLNSAIEIPKDNIIANEPDLSKQNIKNLQVQENVEESKESKKLNCSKNDMLSVSSSPVSPEEEQARLKDVFKFKQTFEEYTNKRDKNWYDEYVEKVNAKYNSSGIDCQNLYINLSKISNGANNYLGITRDHEQNIVNKKFDEMSEHEEFEENEII